MDELERRIVAALQVNPRASWSLIADALREPVRTVTRRGTELLGSGRVGVVGVTGKSGVAIVRAATEPSMARSVTAALAQRPDCTYAYALTGPYTSVAELRISDDSLERIVLDQLPGIAGVRSLRVDVVTRIHRSVKEWRPHLLSADERERLHPTDLPVNQPDGAHPVELSGTDRAILRLLAQDGRMSVADLAGSTRLTENTVRRRLAWLEQSNLSRLRVVVEPADLGYAAEGVVWARITPARAAETVDALLRHSVVRYAVALGGNSELMLDIACTDLAALHAFLSEAPWTRLATSIELATVLTSMKRSGRQLMATQTASYLY